LGQDSVNGLRITSARRLKGKSCMYSWKTPRSGKETWDRTRWLPEGGDENSPGWSVAQSGESAPTESARLVGAERATIMPSSDVRAIALEMRRRALQIITFARRTITNDTITNERTRAVARLRAAAADSHEKHYPHRHRRPLPPRPHLRGPARRHRLRAHPRLPQTPAWPRA